MKPKQNYNQDVLAIMQEKYGYSFDYIRKSIRGDRRGNASITIKKEYDKLSDDVKKCILTSSQKF